MMIGVLKKEQEESMAESQEEGGAEKVDSHEGTPRKVKKRRKRACDPHRKRACVDCTKRCVRVHGRASSSEKARPVASLPSFFKIMMGYFSENMDIPPPFAKTILDLTGSNIYLEDAFGLRWRVRLCLRDSFLSFGHGWKNFVLDHAIGVGEFLVFRQIARSVFTVQIFATSACERLYLCERNKRQSRKRKPRVKSSSTGNQAVKTSKNNGEKRSKKKQRTYNLQNDLGASDGDMSVHVCVDSEIPKAASEPKYSGTSEQAPGNGAAESHEVDEVPTRDQAQAVLDGETETADDCAICEETETGCNAIVGEHPIYDATGSKPLESMVVIDVASNTNDMEVDANTETEKYAGSNFPTNADLRTPLATMDLNEENADDIFLSADIYEFESEFCSPEAFSVELNMEGFTNNGQTSGFSCSRNCDPSMGVGHCFRMPETSSCLENKETTDLPRTSTDAGTDPVHGIDIKALPSNELPAFINGSSSQGIDAEVPPGECAVDACKKDKDSILFPHESNRVEPKEGFVPEDSPAKQDNLQMQDGRGQIAAKIMSRSTKHCKFPELRKNHMQSWNICEGLKSGSLKANNRKFSVAVPPPDQTWLELPCRLPILPRTKKQGRKILVLKDPCTRRWPVLYQCTPSFNGFITGWVDVSLENKLREGDACEFELCSNSELSFQVRVPNFQQPVLLCEMDKTDDRICHNS